MWKIKRLGKVTRMERRRLPLDRNSIVHQFTIGGVKGFVITGMYEDGSPGEIFLKFDKKGSAPHGMLDSFSILLSMALQYGVPVGDLVRKFKHVSFEPFGKTDNPKIPFADSVIDYLFKWMEITFIREPEPATLTSLETK